MKNLVVILILSAFLFIACKEKESATPSLVNNLLEQERRMLIEAFTATNCAGCLSGNAVLEELETLHGSKVVVVAIHSFATGTLGIPINGSSYDLRTAQGDSIADHLAPLTSVTSVAINRKLFNDQSNIVFAPHTLWASYVEADIALPVEVQINTTVSFDPTSRSLNVVGDVLPFQTMDGDIRIVAYLIEDHIITPQLNGTTVDPQYKHNNILRHVLASSGQINGSIKGTSLTTPMIGNTSVPFEFSTFTLPEEDGTWLAENCHVVTFVVKYDPATGSREVIQANEVPLIL